MLTLSDSRRKVLQLMRGYSVYIPQIELELLFSHAIGCSMEALYTEDIPVTNTSLERIISFIKRRLEGEPLQYITGTAHFMDMEFFVNKSVFIPRPETELLINEIIPVTHHALPITILDLCTGSGNIGVTLARFLPQAKIVATDIEESALEAARRNSKMHGVEERVQFYKGNLFESLCFNKGILFDIIVCNPPYVKKNEIPSLQRELRVEPKIALDGGMDGLDFYRRIAKQASGYLKPGGFLFLEIGYGQVDAVKEIFGREDRYRLEKITEDFAGIERVITVSRQ